MPSSYRFLCILSFCILSGIKTYAGILIQDSREGNDSSNAIIKQPLFDSSDPLQVTIISDFKNLVKHKNEQPAYQPAKLILNNDTANVFSIRIKPRGFSRRTYDFCNFPPILLNFKKKDVENTLFENQNKLKLVTYCKNSNANEDFVLQEYLIYKVYNLLTDYSFKVRLAEVTYQDSDDKQKAITRYGFFIESDDNMAQRNNSIVTKIKLANHDRCDQPSIDRFTMFQFMIGNTDWWVENFHNVTLIQPKDKAPVPVPYDFDFSGAVNTPYAKPDPKLSITSVRERFFRGYCRIPGTYENVAAYFNSRKDSIYDLYRNFKYFDSRQAELAMKYYDGFYDIIDDPKQLMKKINMACELKHKHLYEK